MKKCRNKQGIEVNCCCASCAYKLNTELKMTRRCTIRDEPVEPKNACCLWQMSEGLKRAGIGLGMVKRKEYLKYYLERRMEERHQKAEGQKIRAHKTETIRAEFESNNCNIYIF